MYFFCVKSPDKLLNYLMFGQTSIEVKMETLKTKMGIFFIKLTADVTQNVHTLHIWTSTNRNGDRLNQLRVEFKENLPI